MTPNRKDWPLQYRVLARLEMGALALLVMGYLFILHPTRARLERQKAEIERKTDYLSWGKGCGTQCGFWKATTRRT